MPAMKTEGGGASEGVCTCVCACVCVCVCVCAASWRLIISGPPAEIGVGV